MQNLYNELIQPSVNADGTIKPPSNLNRRAAEAIKQLFNMQQHDKTERLKLQVEYRNLVDQNHEQPDYFWNYNGTNY